MDDTTPDASGEGRAEVDGRAARAVMGEPGREAGSEVDGEAARDGAIGHGTVAGGNAGGVTTGMGAARTPSGRGTSPGAFKLPFGLRDGVLVHVSTVPSGKACACLCPSCGGALVAKKGTRVAHHFAHASGAECAHGLETALHLAAKAAIEAAGSFVIPAVQLEFGSYKAPWTLAPAQRVTPEAIVLEQRVGSVVPDVVLTVGGRRLLVEVAVTHYVDGAKRQRLADAGLSTVEVSLGHLSRDASAAAIAEAVVDGVSHKRWVYNARVERERRLVLRAAAALPLVRRGLALHADGCPLPAREWRGKPYANVIDDCLACEYCVETGIGPSDGDRLLCLGSLQIDTVDDWQRAKARSSAGTAPR